MRLGSFLKNRSIFLLTQGLVLSFIIILLAVVDIGIYAIIYVSSFFIITNVVAFIFEYIRKNNFYKGVLQNLENLDKKFLLSEMVEEPNFDEGIILYQILKETNKSMNDNIAKYKISSEEYREYIETWVHEIKTPIASTLLIIENNNNEVTRNIRTEIDKLDAFVEQALFYSRSNNVEKDYAIRGVILKDLVNQTIKGNSRNLIESKVLIELQKLDYEIFTDSKWFEFIVSQIITNSIKYKKDNPKIVFHAIENDNNIVFYITDNGIGIPENELSKVFDKGFTGQNGRKYAKSTGIGLYLAQKLCHKLGLSIGITSKINEGTTIFITFPRGHHNLR
ncbi:MAG: integral rane sensor signal transduction histidine kinase [Clostridiales bacterium]|jgi:signal transduction histidine kinase|nr:integral rane sensor signal transduction histidine kinase [Clostridiales bacterium]